jgi:hypothetical protein
MRARGHSLGGDLSDSEQNTQAPKRGRLRLEIIFGAVCLLFGMLVLPALVYWVGTKVLGPYSGGDLADFYATLFRDLLAGSGRAWLLVAGPYVTLMLLRVILLGFRGRRRLERTRAADA